MYPLEIMEIILDYSLDRNYKLLDWIDIRELSYLCLVHLEDKIPNIFNIIIEKLKPLYSTHNGIFQYYIYSEPKLIELIEYIYKNNLDEINWDNLSKNSAAIHILEENYNKINWDNLSENPAAIHILEKNIDKINWDNLCRNPNAYHILENNINKINWKILSFYPNAIHILENNINKIDWNSLSRNTNALHLLENNISKINWSYILFNTNAINIIEQYLEQYPEKIDFYSVILNPSIHHIIGRILDNMFMKTILEKDLCNIADIQLYQLYKEMDGHSRTNFMNIFFYYNVFYYIGEGLQSSERIYYEYISGRKNTISIIEQNLESDKINWDGLSYRHDTSHILINNLDKVKWNNLSTTNIINMFNLLDSSKIHYIEHNINKLNWYKLSMLPEALPLLEKYPHEINYSSLSLNPAAMHILETNQFKIDKLYLSQNLAIFTVDEYEYRERKLKILNM